MVGELGPKSISVDCWNKVSFKNLTKIIAIQQEIREVSIVVTNDKNHYLSVDTEIFFKVRSSTGSHVNFTMSNGIDPEPITWTVDRSEDGADNVAYTYSKTYSVVGLYTIRVIASNHVSSEEKNYVITIQPVITNDTVLNPIAKSDIFVDTSLVIPSEGPYAGTYAVKTNQEFTLKLTNIASTVLNDAHLTIDYGDGSTGVNEIIDLSTAYNTSYSYTASGLHNIYALISNYETKEFPIWDEYILVQSEVAIGDIAMKFENELVWVSKRSFSIPADLLFDCPVHNGDDVQFVWSIASGTLKSHGDFDEIRGVQPSSISTSLTYSFNSPDNKVVNVTAYNTVSKMHKLIAFKIYSPSDVESITVLPNLVTVNVSINQEAEM